MKVKAEEDDRKLMIRAIRIAEDGIQKGGGPFGAVIARDGIVISESYNEVVNSSDPTAHAEILAIRRACRSLGTHDLSGCILYASCEPCPMCLGAIYWAGIRNVYYTSDRKSAAKAGFADDNIYREIMKEPDRRTISFRRIPGIDGDTVFEKWKRMDSKKTY
jgi:guanine deaminase